MKRKHSYLAALLLAVCAAIILTGALQACTPAQVTGATKLDVGMGAPPAEGWAWLVGVIKIGPEKAEEKLMAHKYTWTFFVLRGSTEISTAEGKKTISAGSGVVIPADQQHAHSYLPESDILVIQLRSADEKLPTQQIHGGKAVSPIGERIDVTGGTDYKLRVRDFSLSRGQRVSDSLNLGPNFGYVQEGTITIRKGDNSSTVEAGKTFILPLDGGDTVSNESTARVHVVLVDVH